MPPIPRRALRGLAAPEPGSGDLPDREPSGPRDPAQYLPARTVAKNTFDEYSRPSGESDAQPIGRYGDDVASRMAAARGNAIALGRSHIILTSFRCETCDVVRHWSGNADQAPPSTIPQCPACSHYTDEGRA